MLGLPRIIAAETEYGSLRSCVALRAGDREGVLLVDEVLGEHEVVIKDLRPPLRRVRNVLTTALLGTGELVLVLRPLDVLMSIHLRRPTPQSPAAARRRAFCGCWWSMIR